MNKIILIIIMIASVITGCNEVEEIAIEEKTQKVNYIFTENYIDELMEDILFEKRVLVELKNEEKNEEKNKIEIVDLFDNKRPLAIMIDNHFMARPQSGLSQAKIIYEILAEGPITRYMMIVDQDINDDIGPIRSARPYFLSFAMEYDSLYVHVGGSEEAKSLIKSYDIDSLNGMKAGFDVFWRITQKKIPHNMYSSSEALIKDADRLRYEKETDDFSPIKMYNQFVPLDGETKADELSITYKKPSTSDADGYVVKYKYDYSIHIYERYVNSNRQTDESNGKDINIENIIIQKIKHRVIDNEGRRSLDMIGEGNGYYISGGKMMEINWVKKSFDSQTHYYINDEEIIFNPGRIFIQVVDDFNQLDII
ncbi:MAG: DUF3048 domain-containing protein [Bacillota bacterium]|nr:DUF3048 domain-containing protein [Bacillota bacterium]